MRAALPENASAILGTVIMPRDFIEILVKDRSTGAIVAERLWSDRFDVTASVIDPNTGATVAKAFQGAAGLVATEDLAFVSDLTVQELTITLAAYGVDVDRILRAYDAKNAQVYMWRGFLNTQTRSMVAPAEIIFVGEVDDIQLPTGADGEEATASLICLSSQELTRSNPDTRSDASQQRRAPGDGFFKYAATVGDWTHWWGQEKGKVEAERQTGTIQKQVDRASRRRKK